MRRFPCADFERAPHRASSHSQSPINLPVKQILGLNGTRITRPTDAWIRALREIDRDDPLAAGNTGEPHFIVKNSLGIVERRDPCPPRGRRTRPPRRLSDQHEPEERVLVQRPSPRFSAAQITSRKLFVAASSFSRAINNSRNDYIVTHKISLRYRQALNRGVRLRDRETRYSKRRPRRLIFFWIFSLTLCPMTLLMWQQINISVSGNVFYLPTRISESLELASKVVCDLKFEAYSWEEALMRKDGKRRNANEKPREIGGEKEWDERGPRFDGMGIRRSLFSAAICAGYFDSLRGHPK